MPSPRAPTSPEGSPLHDRKLVSWKGIAVHLGREIRTVQRWEKAEGLPVHRHEHQRRSTVYAYASELDDWFKKRQPADDPEADVAFEPEPVSSDISSGGYFAKWHSRSTRIEKIRLVVLPFSNLSGDPKQDYFSAGLTDEMITRLCNLDPQRLGVIAATSSRAFAGKPIAEIGRALDVQY